MRFIIAGVIAALFAFSGQAASEPVTTDVVVVVGTLCFIQKMLKSKNLLKLLLLKLNKNKKRKRKLRQRQIVVVVISLMDKEHTKENK